MDPVLPLGTITVIFLLIASVIALYIGSPELALQNDNSVSIVLSAKPIYITLMLRFVTLFHNVALVHHSTPYVTDEAYAVSETVTLTAAKLAPGAIPLKFGPLADM